MRDLLLYSLPLIVKSVAECNKEFPFSTTTSAVAAAKGGLREEAGRMGGGIIGGVTTGRKVRDELGCARRSLGRKAGGGRWDGKRAGKADPRAVDGRE